MSRLIWSLRRVLLVLGRAGVLGLMLLLGVSVFHWRVLVQERSGLIALQMESATLAARLARQRLQPVVASSAEQLAQFYRDLPEVSGAVLAQALAKLYAVANAQGLVLEQGSYRLASEASEAFEPLVRFDIVLPVKGGYPQLRRFMTKSLHDNALLALESVSFSRQTIGDASVDAQLRFSLYLRKS